MVPSEASTGMTEAWMWVRVGSSSESPQPSSSVSRASIWAYRAGLPSIRDQLGWSPSGPEGRDALDHLAVQVQAQVVAGGEVDQPALADPDAAAVDLLDDRVQQVMVGEQLLQVVACRQPARKPAPRRSP